MSSIGTGYDLGASTFSPEGRVFQVEYAAKAVGHAGTIVGLRLTDSVVFGAEKPVVSKMVVQNSEHLIHAVDRHLTLAVTGLVADGRQVVAQAREEATNFRRNYSRPIPPRILAERIGHVIQSYTLYSYIRPYAVACMVGGVVAGKPELFSIDTAGVVRGCFAAAFGRGERVARAELELLAGFGIAGAHDAPVAKLAELNTADGVVQAARVLLTAHKDAGKGRPVTMEFSLCKPNETPALITPELAAAAKTSAQALMGDEEGSNASDEEMA
eukprot:gnl/Ergobibamus_cyprinoides/1091.p1 GENE.gnl/Ergobibamus_cyprinoides/1091~~gnl/Ergobibamus_cyprinoides/1091.p1  ORF type:complete len:271 (-),score=78.70 gnl/Ergobibamus_cyprinoides/1091:21-833(-)